MLELDKEVFYNLDKKVVLVYDSNQQREIFDLGLDIEPGPIVETFSSKGSYPDGKNYTFVEIQRYRLQCGRLFLIFLDQTSAPTQRYNEFFLFIFRNKKDSESQCYYMRPEEYSE